MSDELVRREDAAQLVEVWLEKWRCGDPTATWQALAIAIRALPPVVPPEASERHEGE